MKVVALGGCGGMGRHAVTAALEMGRVSEILVVDIDGERARRFAESDDRLRADQVDVRDEARLRTLLREADVVVSTVGPYYEFGAPVLRAAIEAGCHYIDICDDWETTAELLAMDAEARDAGITAIIGAGASPGITNLLALEAMRRLETVATAADEVVTGWGAGDDDADEAGDGLGAGAAIDHWVQQTSGEILIRRDGAWRSVAPLAAFTVDYPGIGEVVAHTLGHPEPITFPRAFPEIRESVNVMDLPSGVIALLRSVAKRVDAGTIRVAEGARYIERVDRGDLSIAEALREVPRQLLGSIRDGISGKKHLPPLFGLARGTREGRPASVGACLDGEIPGGMGPTTCIPTAVVLDMLARGEITRTGVLAPEAAVDPGVFFERLEPFVARRSSGRPLVRVTESWTT